MPLRPQRLNRPWIPMTKHGIANRVRDNFYHTNAWKLASKRFLEDNPLCIECQKSGRLKPSIITDHIIPKDICSDPWDSDNFQPLCKNCHSIKSAKDKTSFKK